ncbi:Slam-dependent surface lipoprotein [Arsenophonus nasoniae]|uniref:C-lobe and N-lobe beta barrels of Tf-binding protein B n=1 Tax=Arsenophonus nasoniae TaxID=638 RepID=D2U392_9GAMM|nr:Slam-dependent surface lipoprotein [Arsenophonus nasoniae]QBY41605.1 C-lobe and N-lobe beta barrels of Tf-binding protein B [Arsenophonus nasoniae]WGL95405.1 Slam-dependent surface lipoprotein [Arsenophonus nasoniae]WGM01540.1 Slam-dependent surface lipoprotein [Arsenophonus nasoniae]WGM05805.1 Slam-dependent surface lipoprotein [Arsenophonus nasoniae]WGM10817.1 Slam-dependent surface lipoprotein [Arsenophonus nasoniae]
MKKLNIITLLTLSIGYIGFSYAATGYNKSNTSHGNYLIIGEMEEASYLFHKAEKGDPAIGVSELHGGKKIGFSGLTTYSDKDDNNVYKLGGTNSSHHPNMGSFAFAKLDDVDVFFGEWAQDNNMSSASHTAYYAGKDITPEMPNAGTAIYAIKAINDYSNNGFMTGELTADFAQNSLKGSFSHSALTMNIDADINENGSFSGKASADSIEGTTTGHFFGNNANYLAGITQFKDNHQLDTAFAGTKQ